MDKLIVDQLGCIAIARYVLIFWQPLKFIFFHDLAFMRFRAMNWLNFGNHVFLYYIILSIFLWSLLFNLYIYHLLYQSFTLLIIQCTTVSFNLSLNLSYISIYLELRMKTRYMRILWSCSVILLSRHHKLSLVRLAYYTIYPSPNLSRIQKPLQVGNHWKGIVRRVNYIQNLANFISLLPIPNPI